MEHTLCIPSVMLLTKSAKHVTHFMIFFQSKYTHTTGALYTAPQSKKSALQVSGYYLFDLHGSIYIYIYIYIYTAYVYRPSSIRVLEGFNVQNANQKHD